jgi:hypothetical protein
MPGPTTYLLKAFSLTVLLAKDLDRREGASVGGRSRHPADLRSEFREPAAAGLQPLDILRAAMSAAGA